MINNGIDIEQYDKDGDGIADKTEEEIKSQLEPKYESVREAYQSKEGFLAGTGEVIRNTAVGKNTFGRLFGIALDIGLGLFPAGTKINAAREVAKEALNLEKRKFKYQPKKGSKMDNKVEKWTDKAKRYLKQDSTRAALAVFASIVGAVFSGVDINVEVLTQSVTGFLTAGALIYTGWLNIKGFFKDEDKGQ